MTPRRDQQPAARASLSAGTTTSAQTTAALAGSAPAIRLEAAAVELAGRTVWRDVSMSLPAGTFSAVLGANGAGKSTLVRVLLGLQPLSAGRAEVLGALAGQANDRVGYLPQRRAFDASARIRGIDVVRLGYDGARFGLPLPFGRRHRQRSDAVDEALQLVDGAVLAQRPIGQLSGGEQQRLLIAQALVRRPDLLLLDEPLDSLDLPNQSAISGLVSRICRERGVSVVMVAHDVNPILGYLDRVVYLAGGGAATGTPAEVITAEQLTRLYGTPIEVLRAADGRLVVIGGPDSPSHHSDRHTGEPRP